MSNTTDLFQFTDLNKGLEPLNCTSWCQGVVDHAVKSYGAQYTYVIGYAATCLLIKLFLQKSKLFQKEYPDMMFKIIKFLDYLALFFILVFLFFVPKAG